MRYRPRIAARFAIFKLPWNGLDALFPEQCIHTVKVFLGKRKNLPVARVIDRFNPDDFFGDGRIVLDGMFQQFALCGTRPYNQYFVHIRYRGYHAMKKFAVFR